MGNQLGPEHPRSLPNQLRVLLEATNGAEQDQAWTGFLDAYSRLILYVARQKPHDHDAVMDCYAYVLDRLREENFRRLRTFAADGRGKFTTWLMVVVRRLCLDHGRLKHGRAPGPGPPDRAPSHRLAKMVLLDPDRLDLPDERPSVEEDLDRNRLLERLAAAVASLSPSDQLLLALRYRDDRSARQIASLLALPTPFHVYRRLNRVHAALRRALAAPLDRGPAAPGAVSKASSVQYVWKQ